MSMRTFAVNDYGLVMTRDMLKTICKKYFTGFTEKEYDEDEDSFNEVLWDGGLVEHIGNFTGDATEKFPSLFKTAYSNMDELESEFRNKFNRYFPDDFDYRKHICHIVGTYFC